MMSYPLTTCSVPTYVTEVDVGMDVAPDVTPDVCSIPRGSDPLRPKT